MPHDDEYKISNERGLHYVTYCGETVSKGRVNYYLALSDMHAIIRRKKITIRKCLTCSKQFKSEGAHNRMCDNCRRKHDE